MIQETFPGRQMMVFKGSLWDRSQSMVSMILCLSGKAKSTRHRLTDSAVYHSESDSNFNQMLAVYPELGKSLLKFHR